MDSCCNISLQETPSSAPGGRFSKTFAPRGDFDAYWDADKWLVERGYSVGSACGDAPVAVMSGCDGPVAKWRNLMPWDFTKIVALVVSKSFRTEPVYVFFI